MIIDDMVEIFGYKTYKECFIECKYINKIFIQKIFQSKIKILEKNLNLD